jgi:hypothetical protein
MFKEMNFHFAHQRSNPIWPAMQSVSVTDFRGVNARPGLLLRAASALGCATIARSAVRRRRRRCSTTRGIFTAAPMADDAKIAGEKLKVFISYSRRDAAGFADELVAGLELADSRRSSTATDSSRASRGRIVSAVSSRNPTRSCL